MGLLAAKKRNAKKQKIEMEKDNLCLMLACDKVMRCLTDEIEISIQGVTGDFCTPKCGLFSPCPTDKPTGVAAATLRKLLDARAVPFRELARMEPAKLTDESLGELAMR